MELKHFDNLSHKQQNCLVFETELLKLTANEESLRTVGRFFIYSRFVVSAVKLFMRSPETNVMLSFYLLAIFTVKCNDSVCFSFLFPCFLSYSLRTK